MPADDFTKILMSPPVTGMPVETGQLGNMKFDDLHWKRASARPIIRMLVFDLLTKLFRTQY